MKKSRIWAGVTAALLATALVGCSTGGGPDSDENAGDASSNLYERSISLTDGRDVTCVIYSSGYRGGLSCDWGTAR